MYESYGDGLEKAAVDEEDFRKSGRYLLRDQTGMGDEKNGESI